MFIEKALHPQNQFYKYILGCFVIAIAFIIGQLPLTGYLFYLSSSKGIAMPTSETEIFQIMDSSLALVLFLLTFVSVFVFLPTIVRGLHKLDFKDIITTRTTIDYKRILFSFSILGILILVTTGLDYLISPENYIVQFDWIKFLILFIVAVVLIPIQATVEELLFRGYLMQGFGVLFKNNFVPLLLTSICFGLMHGLNPEVARMGYVIMIFYIGTGFLLGVITLMDGGMELAIGFHIANNLISVLLVTTDWGALQTNSILKDISEPDLFYSIFFPLVVAYPILLVIFAKRYQWNNWKQKLSATINYNAI